MFFEKPVCKIIQKKGNVKMTDNNSYLNWLAKETPTNWWHDSADPDELRKGLDHGATGVTTNPVLTYTTLSASPEKWSDASRDISKDLSPQEHAELLLGLVVRSTAEKLRPEYERSEGKSGYVCAQVNPAIAGQREKMLQMARRFQAWAPNVTVKLPGTAAGLDVLEECASEGINVTLTVSFTVPQVIATAERYQAGLVRAQKAGVKTSRCFAVIMIGRLDDYLRDVALDSKADVSESDITQAGLAITKRAYSIFKERNYEAVLIVAALRGVYHMTELAGADLIMSIHPKYQDMLLLSDVSREQRINVPIDPRVIEKLSTMPEFVRAYDPEGMKPEEFINFGLTQRTLSQFLIGGWSRLETFSVPS